MKLFSHIFIFPLLSLSFGRAKCENDQENNSNLKNDEPEPIELDDQSYFQGDLRFRPRLRNAIQQRRRWPDGIIPYSIDSNFTDKHHIQILAAIMTIQEHTCVKFINRTTERDYLNIVNTSYGCYSEGVGKVGGRQVVSLMDGISKTCFTHSIIVHELLHVVGLWHEHMRYDRDEHVEIHKENATDGTAEQFDMIPPPDSSTYAVPYDLLSIMHYSAYAFSADGNMTIEPKDKTYLDLMGRVSDASENDWLKVRRIYECPEHSIPIKKNCSDKMDTCPYFRDSCDQSEFYRLLCPHSCGQCPSKK